MLDCDAPQTQLPHLDDRLPAGIRSKVIARLRSLTPQERFQQMLDLNEFVKETQRQAIQAQYPEADEFEIKMRLASRWVKDPDLLKAAFGWDVAKMGY